jgi:TolA-binding protein
MNQFKIYNLFQLSEQPAKILYASINGTIYPELPPLEVTQQSETEKTESEKVESDKTDNKKVEKAEKKIEKLEKKIEKLENKSAEGENSEKVERKIEKLEKKIEKKIEKLEQKKKLEKEAVPEPEVAYHPDPRVQVFKVRLGEVRLKLVLVRLGFDRIG